MDNSWATKSAQDLLLELEDVERAIARSSTFYRRTDVAGGLHIRICPELLSLAEREHSLVTELRRRHRLMPLAA